MKEQPNLGLATTGQLLDELRARAEINGTIKYKTVESEDFARTLPRFSTGDQTPMMPPRVTATAHTPKWAQGKRWHEVVEHGAKWMLKYDEACKQIAELQETLNLVSFSPTLASDQPAAAKIRCNVEALRYLQTMCLDWHHISRLVGNLSPISLGTTEHNLSTGDRVQRLLEHRNALMGRVSELEKAHANEHATAEKLREEFQKETLSTTIVENIERHLAGLPIPNVRPGHAPAWKVAQLIAWRTKTQDELDNIASLVRQWAPTTGGVPLSSIIKKLADDVTTAHEARMTCLFPGAPNDAKIRCNSTGYAWLNRLIDRNALLEGDNSRMAGQYATLIVTHEDNCQLIADMFHSATGTPFGQGPTIGLLEDVKLIRDEWDRAQAVMNNVVPAPLRNPRESALFLVKHLRRLENLVGPFQKHGILFVHSREFAAMQKAGSIEYRETTPAVKSPFLGNVQVIPDDRMPHIAVPGDTFWQAHLAMQQRLERMDKREHCPMRQQEADSLTNSSCHVYLTAKDLLDRGYTVEEAIEWAGNSACYRASKTDNDGVLGVMFDLAP